MGEMHQKAASGSGLLRHPMGSLPARLTFTAFGFVALSGSLDLGSHSNLIVMCVMARLLPGKAAFLSSTIQTIEISPPWD